MNVLYQMRPKVHIEVQKFPRCISLKFGPDNRDNLHIEFRPTFTIDKVQGYSQVYVDFLFQRIRTAITLFSCSLPRMWEMTTGDSVTSFIDDRLFHIPM